MYIGIDIGTSSVKAILISAEQTVITVESASLLIQQPHPLYSEQNPEGWFNATLKVLAKIKRKYPKEYQALKSIGLTGQMHGVVCLDKKGRVLRPAILWNDGRSHQECQDLMARCPDFKAKGGNILMPGFSAPKLLWVLRHEPGVFKQVAMVLLPKDYIRYRLTGRYSTDMSDASGTLWLDIYKRRWSSEMLSACSLTEKQMPFLQEGTECSGLISDKMRVRLGLLASVKVIAGASDNAAGALAMGVISPTKAMISLGTSGVYFTPTKTIYPKADKGLHAFCHAIPNHWHYMGVILSAASALSWWKKMCKNTSEAELIELASVHQSEHTPLFLPYLCGERTPHNDPFARASFIGMTHATGSAEFAEAVLEGVAFAICDCEKVILEAGAKFNQVCVVGGGAKSSYWGRIIASSLNRPLHYYNESAIGPAFGAARLALYEDSTATLDDIFSAPAVISTVLPDEKLQNTLSQRIKRYRMVYHQLKPVFSSTESKNEHVF